MSYFRPQNKYAPGLGAKYDSFIAKTIADWRKHGIGVVRERKNK